MENASKALVMAGGVLIALMIIGALLLTYNGIRNYQQSDTVDLAQLQVGEFNNQFETYNRKDVRGNDLYSLLNRTVDYNKRQTTAGTTTTARNENAFEPMKINVDFASNFNRKLLAYDQNDNKIFKKNNYDVSSLKNALDKVDKIEDNYGGQTVTNSLASNITKIFIDSNDPEEQKKALDNLSAITHKTYTWNDIRPGSSMRNDIYTYYEYIQFKRAIFECTGEKYNDTTGRIVEMNFKFTGKLQ